MGRPWWYDSYWEKREKPRRRSRLPRRRFWVWLSLVLLSLLLAAAGEGFHPGPASLARGFVDYLCRVLSVAIFVRALLSWFLVGGYNRFVIILDDATEPILWPLRRLIPAIGRFDITPLVAIIILNLIPAIIDVIV